MNRAAIVRTYNNMKKRFFENNKHVLCLNKAASEVVEGKQEKTQNVNFYVNHDLYDHITEKMIGASLPYKQSGLDCVRYNNFIFTLVPDINSRSEEFTCSHGAVRIFKG